MIDFSSTTTLLATAFFATIAIALIVQLLRVVRVQKRVSAEMEILRKIRKRIEPFRAPEHLLSQKYPHEVEEALHDLGPSPLRRHLIEYSIACRLNRGTYDPEVYIRQIFKQREHDALVTGSSLFVRIGLLGTFVGLMIGVSSIDTTSADSLTSSVQVVLDGMAVAFSSSLAGLVASFVFHWRERSLEDAYEEWEDLLSTVLGQYVGPSYLLPLDVSLQAAADGLSSAVPSLAQAAQGLSETMSGITTAVDAMGRGASDSLDGLKSTLSGFDQIFTDTLGKAVGQMERVATSNTKVVQSIEGEIKRISAELIKQLKEEIATNVEVLNRLEKGIDSSSTALSRQMRAASLATAEITTALQMLPTRIHIQHSECKNILGGAAGSDEE